MSKRSYLVTYRESVICVERIWASTAAEAIELVRMGEGERLAEDRDDYRGPQAFSAARETQSDGTKS